MKFCFIIGHKWVYKDYTNMVETSHKKWAFKKSRRCKRCQKKEVLTFNNKWVV